MEEIRNWLVDLYLELGIKGLQIESVMSVIKKEYEQIKISKQFGKRFAVSKNLSILVYESGTVEIHCTIKNVFSTFESFSMNRWTNKIVAKLSSNGNLLHFEFVQDGGIEILSTQDLMDFVDSDIPLFYEDKVMNVNEYLGESRCFTARQIGHSF